MPGTAAHLGLTAAEVFEPEKNVAAAARYLRRKEKEFSRTHALFGCFNSLDQASEREREQVLRLIAERLNVDLRIE